MSVRLMVFIDGSWIFRHKADISAFVKDPDCRINYAKIPTIIVTHLEKHASVPIDLVRVCFFGTIPGRYPGDDHSATGAFFEYLRSSCRFEIEVFETDGELHPPLRDRERCVEVALASSMIQYASIPGSFDVATLVAGGADYIPMLKRLRMMGKRTMLATLGRLGSNQPTSHRLVERIELFDYPHLMLTSHLNEMRMVRPKTIRACVICQKEEETDWTGRAFYCNDCRTRYRKPDVGMDM